MIAVIQCAARKRSDAGHLVSLAGQPVTFVANPETAPAIEGVLYARPDDLSDYGWTWRDALLKYNDSTNNPLRLLPAWQLYENSVYERLVARLGFRSVFILSAAGA